jgi:hypothetical protein
MDLLHKKVEDLRFLRGVDSALGQKHHSKVKCGRRPSSPIQTRQCGLGCSGVSPSCTIQNAPQVCSLKKSSMTFFDANITYIHKLGFFVS